MTPDDIKYAAVRSRDQRFDGEFFFAVRTTGIYCRPSCPATTPRRRNVSFFPTAAAAQGSGFRACRRCRPDAVPGSAEWNVRADLVGRAMRLIADGVVDREGVSGLAARLGYSARQVQRQLTAEVGAGPLALARAQRAHTARVLLRTTPMQAAQIAFAAGFSSVRQFNDTMREIYAATPGELREARPRGGARTASAVPLRLAHRGAYDARAVFDQLAGHAVPGVEEVVPAAGRGGGRRYRRTMVLPHGTGIAEVGEAAGAGGRGWLDCTLRLDDPRDLTTAAQRMRRLFDLDADPDAVAALLATDPLLAPLVAARPGVRVPGAAEPTEFALLAVLGQGLAPGAAARLGGAVTAAYGRRLAVPDGGLTHTFPTPGALAGAALETEVDGVGPERAVAVRALAAALGDGTVCLDAGAERDVAEKALRMLPGVWDETAALIRMRALGDPDVLLPGPGFPGGAADARWRPWRSYASQLLGSPPGAAAPGVSVPVPGEGGA